MTSPSKKRTTGPKNDAMKYIVEIDQQLKDTFYSAPIVDLSEVRYRRGLRRDYVRTIEAKET